ncbi:multicellular organismal development [Nesidiocoris tenuis]|uniref:Multicellular organismal development n=1 Tax=Nesidiocoris tenuis TaxID=355587 RepID=A0ABN7B1N7_9HEMI|nr:multicellular organismal development [Nesidiocoris tenuis]
MTSTSTASSACDHVALKLPKFWTYDPESWFFNVDSQFALRNITRPDTKLQHLLSVMEPSQIKEISDVPTTESRNEQLRFRQGGYPEAFRRERRREA